MVEFEKVDMDEFIAGCVQRFCPVCGTQIRQKETGRPRKFCSDPCRRRYWKAHPKPEQWDSYHEQVCPDRVQDGGQAVYMIHMRMSGNDTHIPAHDLNPIRVKS